MVSLKIKKYRPYADVTMVVNEDVEIHLGMLSEDEVNNLITSLRDCANELHYMVEQYD